MFGYLYEWMENITYFMILTTALLYVLPSNSYRKYIRFFTGVILVLLLFRPFLNLFHVDGYKGKELYLNVEKEYENTIMDWFDEIERHSAKEDKLKKIEVEEIVVEP